MTDYRPPLKRHGLSKSKIAAFEQCPKRLWLQVHRPEAGEYSLATQAVFATGHQVGSIACDLVPGGIMVEAEPDIRAAIDLTRELIAVGNRYPIFEATFQHEGVLVRVDIMEPDGTSGWRVAEVKSTSRVKDYQISDLATQVWVMQANGVHVAAASIRHIDTSFVLPPDRSYAGLLVDTSVETAMAPLLANRGAIVTAARETLAGPEPVRAVGKHCTDPFSCPFDSYCRQGTVEPQWPISLLPRTGAKLAETWAAQGVVELTDLPVTALKNELHVRIHQATASGATFHDPDGAATITATWAFPRTWLDFETISFAVPRWVGTKPYQQLPFQFSAHVEAEDGNVEHREFLSLDGEDPRRACAEALIELIPAEGAIIAYNAPFERSCIDGLAATFPDLAPQLTAMSRRIVDLHPVAQKHWYHRDQRGSWSIKYVLPTVLPGQGYSDLEVQDGAAAQRYYLEAIAPDTSPRRREEIDQALRAYCGRDSEAMLMLCRELVRPKASLAQH